MIEWYASEECSAVLEGSLMHLYFQWGHRRFRFHVELSMGQKQIKGEWEHKSVWEHVQSVKGAEKDI